MTTRLFALALTLMAGAAVVRATAVTEQVPLRQPLASVPAALGGWRAVGDIALDRETVDILRADDYLNRRYASESGMADLFVGYYASQRQGGTMHSPMNCLPATGWQPLATGRAAIDVPGKATINANRYVIQKGLDQRLVYYWFQSHGRTVASEYASKAYLVLDSLRLHRSDAALVRVITPIARNDIASSDTAATAFIRALDPVLATHIPR